MNEEICLSLELAAEKGGDITPAVYANYFARCEGSEALMSHIDDLVRGKMLNEVFRLLMEPTLAEDAKYLDFEVDNHRRAYMVEPHMYRNLLEALHETVVDVVGEDWTPAMESEWQGRIEELLTEIANRHPT